MEKIPNLGNRTILKLAITKSLENSIFCRALCKTVEVKKVEMAGLPSWILNNCLITFLLFF